LLKVKYAKYLWGLKKGAEMRGRKYFWVSAIALIMSSLLVSGCAVNFYKQSPRSKKKIEDLKLKIDDLEAQRAEEREKFKDVKRLLEEKLRSQISDKSISLSMDDRGLVIILSDDILFDSGKAKIKKDAYPVLNEVAKVIKTEVPGKNIGITGHTDNVPIKYSGWKSNWELSAARGTEVLHYLEKKGVPGKRLSAIGYGKQRPISSNLTEKGRAKNRRVEIVILPEFVTKKRGEKPQADAGKIKENNFAKTKETYVK